MPCIGLATFWLYKVPYAALMASQFSTLAAVGWTGGLFFPFLFFNFMRINARDNAASQILKIDLNRNGK
jgi:hypothetical protein